MEPKGSLPRSQEPAICTYPEPDQSSPWALPNPVPGDHFYACSQNCEKQLLASSCLPVCPPVCPSVSIKKLGSHMTDFHEIWYLSIFFPKICRENSSFIEIIHEGRVLYMKTNIRFNQSSLNCPCNEKYFRQFVGKIKTHIVCSINFFSKNLPFVR